MNPFLALRDEELTVFDEDRRLVVRRRVERELRSAEFITSMVELFGPVLADTLTVLGGGEAAEREPDAPDYFTVPDDDDGDEPAPFGPAAT